MKEAVTFIEHGHVRVGPEVVTGKAEKHGLRTPTQLVVVPPPCLSCTDPAFLVTRTFEDLIAWVDSSRIKRAVAKCVGSCAPLYVADNLEFFLPLQVQRRARRL